MTYTLRHTSLIKTLRCIHTLACLAGERTSSFDSSSNVTVLHRDPKQSARWQQNVQSFSQRSNRLKRGKHSIRI